MNVTYTATLIMHEETVLYLAELLRAERLRRRYPGPHPSAGCFKQAVLVIRWFLDGTRVAQVASDNAVGKSTVYDYLSEGTAGRLENAAHATPTREAGRRVWSLIE